MIHIAALAREALRTGSVVAPYEHMPAALKVCFRYAWLFGAGVWLLGLVLIRARLKRLVGSHGIREADVSGIVRAGVVVAVVPCAALGFTALWAGYTMPFCSSPLSPHSTPDRVAGAIIVLCTFWFLGWIWLGSGARALGSVASAWPGTRLPAAVFQPISVRLIATIVVLLVIIGNATQASQAKQPSDLCQLGP